MDGQHSYEINLKKDDLFIELSSDDVYFISKQMDKWFRILLDDSYVPVSLPKPPAPAQPAETVPVQAAEPEAPAAPVAPVAPPPAPVSEQPAAPQSVPQAQPTPEPIPQPVPQPVPVAEVPPAAPQPVVEPQPVSVAPAVPIPAPQAEIPQPQPVTPQPVAPPVSPQPAASLDQAVQDDFEAVMDTLMQDLEADDDTPPAASASTNGNGRVEAPPITSLSELCDRSSAGTSEDYLLLSAYYITQFEQQEKFSLKRINAMLVKSGLTPVNHSVLETTLTQGYLSMVPDLTGMAEVSEYALTTEGQQAATGLL